MKNIFDFNLQINKIAGVFTTSKTDCHLLCQKVRLRIAVIPENWHFNSRFVLKTTKTPVFVFINEIL